MDDFYSEMKYTLEENDSKTESSNSATSSSSSSIFAEALVPINPIRWPAYAAGSILTTEDPDFMDKLKRPFNNLEVMKEYIDSPKSDVQYRDRFWQVAQDTTTINAASEIGQDGGAFAAGVAANKIADKYMDEMVHTELSMNEQEKLNYEIFKQVGRENNVDVSTIRGTGYARQFVPEYMKEDVCKRPARNERPDAWDNNDWDNNDGLDDSSSSNPNGPNNPNDGSNGPQPNGDELDSPGGSSTSYQTGPSENLSVDYNNNDNNLNLIGKFLNFCGFNNHGGNSIGDFSSTISSEISADQAEILRNQAEKALVGELDPGGSLPMGNPDPSAPSNNPPLFLMEYIPPTD